MSIRNIARLLQAVVAEEEHHDEGEHSDDHEEEDHSDHEGAEHDDHDDHDDHGGELDAVHDGESSSSVDIKTLKIILLFCMVLCVGFGLVPKVWGKCRNNEQLLSNLNCFSAGIFLGMALIHMMPESSEIHNSWAAEKGIEKPFPLPYVMYFIGYMLILCIDRVIAKAYNANHHGEKVLKIKQIQPVIDAAADPVP